MNINTTRKNWAGCVELHVDMNMNWQELMDMRNVLLGIVYSESFNREPDRLQEPIRVLLVELSQVFFGRPLREE
jgi:hypothetical protein